MTDKAISFETWLNTEADLEEMDSDILAEAAWNAAIKQAKRQVVDEIMACGLRIIEPAKPFMSNGYTDLNADEVSAIVEDKLNNSR